MRGKAQVWAIAVACLLALFAAGCGGGGGGGVPGGGQPPQPPQPPGGGVADIRGYVRPPAMPPWEIVGATVTISGNGIDQATTSVAGGEYWFRDIPEGLYTLSASAPGYQPFSRAIYVAGSMVTEPYTFLSLAPNGFPVSSASGRVVDGTGNPIANATVSTQPHSYTAFTDAQGQYRFQYLPSDNWPIDFVATAQGYTGNCRNIAVPAGSSVAVPDIVLARAPVGNRIFFTENFDSNLSNWRDIERPNRMYLTHDLSHQGAGCLAMEFHGGDDDVAAGWMHHWIHTNREGTPMVYEGTQIIYMRWYQRWSSNFLFKGHNVYALSGSQGAAQTDHTLYMDPAPEDPITEEPSPTGRPLVMIRATTPICDSDNYCSWRVNNVVIQRNRWYCFEILATMNQPYDPAARQPSLANGTIRFWLDGVELLNLGGLFMRHGLITAHDSTLNSYSRVMIGPYYHGGVPAQIDRMYSWMDDLVVANYRVGP